MDVEREESSDVVSSVRLYGSAIAVVSGAYSVYLATSGLGMPTSAWFMLALGVVVFVHGVALLTPLATKFAAASGPLMLGYAALMLANQLLMALRDPASPGGGGMDGGMGGSGMSDAGAAAGGMGWDAGMVAIALLMLASGAIMTARRRVDETPRSDRM